MVGRLPMRKMPEHFQAKFSRQRRIDDGHAPHWKECDCDGRCQWHHGAVEGSIKKTAALRPRLRTKPYFSSNVRKFAEDTFARVTLGRFGALQTVEGDDDFLATVRK
jgi:hypothetical protein